MFIKEKEKHWKHPIKKMQKHLQFWGQTRNAYPNLAPFWKFPDFILLEGFLHWQIPTAFAKMQNNKKKSIADTIHQSSKLYEARVYSEYEVKVSSVQRGRLRQTHPFTKTFKWRIPNRSSAGSHKDQRKGGRIFLKSKRMDPSPSATVHITAIQPWERGRAENRSGWQSLKRITSFEASTNSLKKSR